jgi:formate dehydrogenase major subunit
MELYISDHPLDCLTCSANGNCELQDMAGVVGLREVRYGYDGENHLTARSRPDTSNPYFTFDPSQVHRLLALRARLRGDPGHVRADRRGPRLRSKIAAGPTAFLERSACPAAPACRPARRRR